MTGECEKSSFLKEFSSLEPYGIGANLKRKSSQTKSHFPHPNKTELQEVPKTPSWAPKSAFRACGTVARGVLFAPRETDAMNRGRRQGQSSAARRREGRPGAKQLCDPFLFLPLLSRSYVSDQGQDSAWGSGVMTRGPASEGCSLWSFLGQEYRGRM